MIKDWDITARLGAIGVPTLLISGRYDEATPALVKAVHLGIPGSEWALFEESSHSCHLEEPEKFLRVVTRYLDRLEATG